MLAGPGPEDLDDLSEEGRQNLQIYLESEALEWQSRQHEEIMEKFGAKGRDFHVS